MGRIIFLLLLMLFGAVDSVAQEVGPNEGLTLPGHITQNVFLTKAQRVAIYNIAMQQRMTVLIGGISAIVGAPVPPSTSLADIPEDTGIGGLLKYVMMDEDILVVDPLQMRVVDVIHGMTKR